MWRWKHCQDQLPSCCAVACIALSPRALAVRGERSGTQGREEGVAHSEGRREWHAVKGGGSGTQVRAG